MNVENDYPGLKKFFECFSQFRKKFHVDYLSESDYDKLKLFDFDSDSDDIYSDSDEYENEINEIFSILDYDY